MAIGEPTYTWVLLYRRMPMGTPVPCLACVGQLTYTPAHGLPLPVRGTGTAQVARREAWLHHSQALRIITVTMM